MNLNISNLVFSAKIVENDGARGIERILKRASACDYWLSGYMDYKGLYSRINKILPSEFDTVIFNNVKDLSDLKEGAHSIDGSIIHDKKNKNFTTTIFCTDGSFSVGSKIIDAIEKQIKD